eukprot:TRINITY_DN11478_c0_g1_i1.p1 TRINITY_DN11478_c0_g1~~TRINITY_DN11478_c0_g1_i1.p1  ORF type:complete len:517 (+),score=57.59 TRINITY_DN11478_c0_g1_i1:49-1599(+)
MEPHADPRPDTLSLDLADASLLRGSQLRYVLSGMGINFQPRDLAKNGFTSEEAAKLYSCSCELDRVRRFLSHSWRSKRWEKTIALLEAANLYVAMIVSTLAACIGAVLASQDVLPHARVIWYYMPDGTPVEGARAPWGLCFGSLAFFLAFFYAHEVRNRFHTGNTYFFDNLCVHQYDKEKKTAGILSFSAVVQRSDEFVMLWDDSYFERLWCTLEMATLVHVHRDKELLPLTFLPLKLQFVAIGGWLVWMFNCSCFAAITMTGLSVQFLPMMTCSVSMAFVAPVVQKYIAQRNQLSTQLLSFKVSDATCTVEDDRALVLRTLKAWFGNLERFDEHVHTVVQGVVTSRIGSKVHYPLRYAYVILLVHLWDRLDVLLLYGYTPGVGVQDFDAMVKYLVGDLIVWPLVLLSFGPVGLRITNSLASMPVHTRKFKALLHVIGLTTAMTLYVNVLWFFVTVVVHTDFGLAYGCIGSFLMLIWNMWLFRDSWRKRALPTQPSDQPASAIGLASSDAEESVLV